MKDERDNFVTITNVPNWEPPKELEEAIEAYMEIVDDMNSFDGDKRGIAMSLLDRQIHIVELIGKYVGDGNYGEAELPTTVVKDVARFVVKVYQKSWGGKEKIKKRELAKKLEKEYGLSSATFSSVIDIISEELKGEWQ